jgi:hypothetical protein
MAVLEKDSRIRYDVNENGCWIVRSESTAHQYIQIIRNNRKTSVHRWVYELYHGKIEDNLVIMHTCDNTRCANPDHLKAGTNLDNMKDRYLKGRHVHGTRCGNSKLTDEKVLAIMTDNRSCDKIAVDYEVSRSLITHIKKGISWRHITNPDWRLSY